jgi:amino acid transporter
MKLRRSLTTLTLVFVMYFNTSGGAFTTEALVAEVGPGLALLILLLVPLVYSLPETLIVGELASMLPEEGGSHSYGIFESCVIILHTYVIFLLVY